jgi:hypothetical protein
MTAKLQKKNQQESNMARFFFKLHKEKPTQEDVPVSVNNH